jgi:hypothetical protein
MPAAAGYLTDSALNVVSGPGVGQQVALGKGIRTTVTTGRAGVQRIESRGSASLPSNGSSC